MRQRIASLLSVLPLILLQQVIINKVVNTHCMTHISQCLCSYSLCLSAALPKDIINIRQTFLPHLTTLTDRCQLRLHHVVQELLHLDIAEPTAGIMLLQLIKTAVVRQKFLKIFRFTERIQISKYCVALNLSRDPLRGYGSDRYT